MPRHRTKARLELVQVASEDQWRAYHDIRRKVLFEARGRSNYDAAHPDELRPGNHPLLLLADGESIATARLDDEGEELATIRLVAVSTHVQRQGFGRAMMKRLEAFAQRQGIRRLRAHVAPDAVPFYLKIGWEMIQGDLSNPLMEKSIEVHGVANGRS